MFAKKFMKAACTPPVPVLSKAALLTLHNIKTLNIF